MRLTVATYNIGSVLNELRRANIARHIGQSQILLHVDVICLQEVYFTWEEAVRLRDEKVNKAFPFSSFGENAQFFRGRMGNLTLSKYPIEQSKNFDLSVKGREARGCLSATIRLSQQRRLDLLNVHLGLRSWERTYQFDFLSRYVDAMKDSASLVITGDFNDWKSAIHSIILEQKIFKDASEQYLGKLSKTFPSFLPLLPLDRIYFRNLQLDKYTRHYKGWRGVSDHLPISATFSM